MSMNRTVRRQPPPDLSRPAPAIMDEAILLRFLVQHGLLANGLLKAADMERRGAGSPLSLLDWLVCRGHVSEKALTLALAHCLRLGAGAPPLPSKKAGAAAGALTPFARLDLEPRRRRVALRLVRGRARES